MTETAHQRRPDHSEEIQMSQLVSSTALWSGEAVLFDLDGTLIESMTTIERHTRKWALAHDLDPDEVLDNWHGRRDADVIAEYVPEDQVTAELAWMREISCTDVAGITPIPGGRDLLAQLPPNSWGIVTSGERQVALSRIAAAGIPCPKVLVTADEVTNGKPHPEGFLKAAALLGVDPAACLVFEDADSGVAAATAAGMSAVLIGDAATSSGTADRLSSFKQVECVTPSNATARVLLAFFPWGT
ncbi:HAD-IA family hydrolase [Streptomyces sp. NPDC048248]|uniref:HAD-IA family hydrolase n=1 Tax=Streptomyces sp. NPDC048248 TaxID=3365523 RepID=UPI00371F46E3